MTVVAALVAIPSMAHAAEAPATDGSAIASTTTSTALIPTDDGAVHYPACSGPLTWFLDTNGIPASGSTPRAEARMWNAIFSELDTATDYAFARVTDAGQAAITIQYADDPAGLGLPTGDLASGTAGVGGITRISRDDDHWIATASTVVMRPVALRSMPRTVRAWVARHELGHALGLGHTDDPTRLMAPRYNPLFPQATFQPDDIAGLQALARTNCPPGP